MFPLKKKKGLAREKGAQAGDSVVCSYFKKLILGAVKEGAVRPSCVACLARLPEAGAGDPRANAHGFLPEQDAGAHACTLPSSTGPG